MAVSLEGLSQQAVSAAAVLSPVLSSSASASAVAVGCVVQKRSPVPAPPIRRLRSRPAICEDVTSERTVNGQMGRSEVTEVTGEVTGGVVTCRGCVNRSKDQDQRMRRQPRRI